MTKKGRKHLNNCSDAYLIKMLLKCIQADFYNLQIYFYHWPIKRSYLQRRCKKERGCWRYFIAMQLSQQTYSAGCITSKGTVRCTGLVIALRTRFHSRSVYVLKISTGRKVIFAPFEAMRVACFPSLLIFVALHIQETPFSMLDAKKSNSAMGARSPTLQNHFLVS